MPDHAPAAIDTAAPGALASRDPEMLIARLRQEIRRGRLWWEALLETAALWDLGEEQVEKRHYRYLIGGEALDWLCLAERLCDALAPDGLLPPDEVEALLADGQLPVELDEAALRRALGPTKYRAHLNFVYGVCVEEALQLSVEEALQKERRSWAAGYDSRVDEETFRHIYGAPRRALLATFRREQQRPDVDRISLAELKEFTYWLFKRRLATQDPARVASDTRCGLRTLNALEETRRRRRRIADKLAREAVVVDAQVVHDPVTTRAG